MKAIQKAIEPGIAITWYFVQLFVTSPALPSTVSRTAPYIPVPHTQWPAVFPSPWIRSHGQSSTPKM